VAHTIALPDAANVSALSIAGPEDQWIVVGNTQGHVTVLSRADGQQLAAADVPEQQIVDVHLLAATNKLLVLTANGTVQTFAADLAGGQLTAAETMQSGNGAYKQLTGNADTAVFRTEGPMVEVRKAASLQSATAITASAATQNASLSADGQRLLIITTDGKAELWNAADGKQVATLSQNMLASRHQQHQQKDKAAREARVNVVKGQIEEAEKRVTEHTESLKKAEEELTKAQAAKTEADTKLAEAVAKTAEANKALEAKPDDGELKKKVEEAQKAEQAAKDAVTTADNQLSSAEKGKQLTQQAIERATGIVNEKKQLLTSVEAELATSVAQLEQATQAAGQPIVVSHGEFAGSSPIVATIDQSAVRLWNAVDGSAVDVLPLQTNGTSIVCATDQSATLRQADGNLTTVNLYPQWQLSGVLGPDGAGQGSVFADRVLSLAFSPDGKLLAAGGGEASRTGELTLWSIPDGQLVRQFEDPHSDTIYGLEFSADGKLLATAAADKFVKVFNVSSGEHVRSYEGHTHHVMDVSWKGDGTTLASAGADNAIKVWNAETGEQARTITTYSKQVTSLQFIGMQDEFVSCSGDKRVFVHTAGNGKAVREFKGCPDYVYSSATTADGSIVAAGCEDGVLRIWNGKDGKEIASFAAE
jgi:WD40 repeat protein